MIFGGVFEYASVEEDGDVSFFRWEIFVRVIANGSSDYLFHSANIVPRFDNVNLSDIFEVESFGYDFISYEYFNMLALHIILMVEDFHDIFEVIEEVVASVSGYCCECFSGLGFGGSIVLCPSLFYQCDDKRDNA